MSAPNPAADAGRQAGGDAVSPSRGPLTGVRVIELATVLMAPYAGQMLGDLGADVIKVEPPSGDSNRFMNDGPHPQLSGIAMNLHRNKKSIVLDLKRQPARDALVKLIAGADVLVTNFRPSALDQFGLQYEAFAARSPRLVYCEAHGFRTDSPDANGPAFDDTIQALTGTPALSEEMGLDSRFPPFLLADKVAATAIVSGVLAALYERERSGLGQRVEVPMFDTVLAFNLTEHLARAAVPGGRVGYSRILTLNRGPHQTSDGWLALMPYTNRHWRALYEAAGYAHLLEQPWHKDMPTRLAQADVVYAELKSIIREKPTAYWLEICAVTDVPVARVPRLQEIVDDAALHRGVLRTVKHPIAGNYRHIASPVIFSRTPAGDDFSPAPLLGQDTTQVLQELGYSRERAADAARTRDDEESP
jgi:crotonobetainyl-CoA:carnitine CoA-transferase CaiB-like acyl-CoA transferase